MGQIGRGYKAESKAEYGVLCESGTGLETKIQGNWFARIKNTLN
jgi:hypothetical protein